jgi:hypothetical protein
VTRTDGSVLFFVEKIPDSLNLNAVRKLMGEWTLEKAEPPFVKEILSLEYLRHKTSKLLRGMAAGYFIPHNDDKECASVPGNLYIGRSGTPQLKSLMEQMLILSWDATRTSASAAAGKDT